MTDGFHNDLFSSLISDIKTYTGKDPILPWLRGIRKLKESLPPQLLKGKLPRFLQKCAQTFEADRRYRNDLRYLRVWIQLLDFVDDPRALLKTMAANRIGTKLALFYQAYALYYEKVKNFEEAEKVYRLGVQNLAEPANELQKSYEQLLRRMELYKKRISRVGRTAIRPLADRTIPAHSREIEETKEDTSSLNSRKSRVRSGIPLLEAENDHKNTQKMKIVEEISPDMVRGKSDSEAHLHRSHLGVLVDSCDTQISSYFSPKKEVMGTVGPKSSLKHQESSYVESDKPSTVYNENTIVVKFVDTAIIGKSEPEDAFHHGLVDPTINMKEAMNAINSMFREPLEPEPAGRRRSHRTQPRVNQAVSNEFEVFIDEGLDKGVEKDYSLLLDSMHPANPASPKKNSRFITTKCVQEPFQIFVDDESNVEGGDIKDENNNLAHHVSGNTMLPAPCVNAFVFSCPEDLSSNGSGNQDIGISTNLKFQEDTVVCRFVGSTISDEPEVENACHHGLVDPTINLKEAMADINSMFGKPLDFVKTNRRKKQCKVSDGKRDHSVFSILPDDDIADQPKATASLSSSSKLESEFDLFEPTAFTKEAMSEINDLFGKPLDF
ncbi:hypothetical protein NE237_003834 [Protea cynaroides]|uniref:BUB1 N-terminal domain-containing protein n=1 Tax=Protea cynaroides TaxID=273540 RepID=A0A9Q0QST4_9MAGN|nr:hypothetical protein NE237_003834 [Protea cynaroides]